MNLKNSSFMSPFHASRKRSTLRSAGRDGRSILYLAGVAAAVQALEGVGWAGLTSANYKIEPVAFGGGASLSTSANYSSFSGVAGFVVGTGTSSSYTAHYGFFPSAGVLDVTGRFIFYNGSSWDGSAAANANDDLAIATDKTALLPGGVAAFANYTSYLRGINGIMIDLPNGAAPTASDFVFKRGNNNTPSGWSVAPNPSSISVRKGAGVAGADRVTLIWPNQQITKQWLEVTVLATVNTGLSVPDKFYFGNAIGETGVGNTATRFSVTSVDVAQVVSNPLLSGAPITSVLDHNRDKRVNSQDVAVAVSNPTVGALALIKLTLTSGDAMVTPLASVDRDDLQVQGGGGPGVAEYLGQPEVSEKGGLRLWMAGPADLSSRVEYTTDLIQGRWDPVPSEWLQDEGDGLMTVNLPPDAPQRFLRLRPAPAETVEAR